MLKWNWNVVMLGGFLFCVIFFFQGMHYPYSEPAYSADPHSHPGLLLFMLPGIVSAHFARRHGLLHGLMGALVVAPLCMLIRLAAFSRYESFLDTVVYFIGAAFWCGLGTLLYVFGSRILLHYKSHARRALSQTAQKKYSQSNISQSKVK